MTEANIDNPAGNPRKRKKRNLTALDLGPATRKGIARIGKHFKWNKTVTLQEAVRQLEERTFGAKQ